MFHIILQNNNLNQNNKKPKINNKTSACLIVRIRVLLILSVRDIAQLGRAPALGAGCRRFKSYYPDF